MKGKRRGWNFLIRRSRGSCKDDTHVRMITRESISLVCPYATVFRDNNLHRFPTFKISFTVRKTLTQLLNSILSNLLLVLGCSCLLGGSRYRIQRFTTVSGAVSSGMLMVATSGLVLPCALKMSGQEDDGDDEINFSRGERDCLEFNE